MAEQQLTVPQLVREVQSDVTHLVKAEVAMAKAEVVAAGRRVGVGAGALVAALVLLLPVVLALVLGAGFAFSLVLPFWLAFLCAAGSFLLVAVAVALVGLRQLKAVRPPQAPERLKDDLAAVSAARAATG